jgi:hypothetical protein
MNLPHRWPAYAVAALFLGYAVGKAGYAVQGRLGFPGGPPVSAAETEGYFLNPSVAQWLASATGVAGACVAMATVTAVGRRVPRRVMWPALAALVLAAVGGGGIMVVDGFIGLGVGWQAHHGVLGILLIALVLAMTRSWRRTADVVSTGGGAGRQRR